MAKPIKFLTDLEIEERSAEILDKYFEGGRENLQLPIDIDTFIEYDLKFRIVWKPIDDPPNCRTFATITPERLGNDFSAKLTLNECFADFLTSHQEIERMTKGHEVCHWFTHIDFGKLQTGILPFEEDTADVRFHRSNYLDAALTEEQKNLLAKFAIVDSRAHQVLKPRENDLEACIEPQWMHRQAEHFSSCLLVPRKPLFRALETADDPSLYSTHIKLAELFQVSKRVIQIRLKKIGIIEEYAHQKFRNVPQNGRFMF